MTFARRLSGGMLMNKNFNYRINRLYRLMTRAELAEKAGCHVGVIDALEGGHHIPKNIKQRIDGILKVKK
jgi:hypothetical protein